MKDKKLLNLQSLISLTFCCLFLLFKLNVNGQQNRGAGVKPKENQTTEKRLALVIGNGTYKNTTPLVNPVNDAIDTAAALRELGFEVLSATNADKRQMEQLMREFGD